MIKMITGTYDVILKTPMGPKKGKLVLDEKGTTLNGKLLVMKQENRIEPGTINGNTFSFSGKLKTALGVTAYQCRGQVTGDEMDGKVVTKKATMILK